MPSITIVEDVLNNLDPSICRFTRGFPPCQVCHRVVRNGLASTDGLHWSFGHPSCVPSGYWMPARDFECLEAVLDWAYHLSEKLTLGRRSWLDLIEYVRPQWLPAAREVMHRYFAALQQ